jgi:hypothetical protein
LLCLIHALPRRRTWGPASAYAFTAERQGLGRWTSR